VSTNPDTARPVEALALRTFAGHFATGVAVLTTRDSAGRPYGLTMNAISCVCLEPPLFLACVDKKSATLSPLMESGIFALNILAVGQDKISNTFASKGDDKFASVATETGVLGVPLIAGALASAEFRVRQTVAAGDHVIVIGEAVATTTRETAPLMYFRGKYGVLAT
jgi:flavin reductase (DIM6/NTAB) family NADH-FMN oxidoreductase RutF